MYITISEISSLVDSVCTNRVHHFWSWRSFDLRPSPDFSPRRRYKIWEGPGDEAMRPVLSSSQARPMMVNHLSSYTNTEVVAFLVKNKRTKVWGSSTPAYIWQTLMPLFIVPKRSCDGLMYTYHHGQVMMEGYHYPVEWICCLVPSPLSSFQLLTMVNLHLYSGTYPFFFFFFEWVCKCFDSLLLRPHRQWWICISTQVRIPLVFFEWVCKRFDSLVPRPHPRGEGLWHPADSSSFIKNS